MNKLLYKNTWNCAKQCNYFGIYSWLHCKKIKLLSKSKDIILFGVIVFKTSISCIFFQKYIELSSFHSNNSMENYIVTI